MLWRDLRDYLNTLDRLGELKRINGAGWEEDIGGITGLMVERTGPALLFDEIRDYPKGYRVAANLFNTVKRTGIAFGLDLEPGAAGLTERAEPQRSWPSSARWRPKKLVRDRSWKTF